MFGLPSLNFTGTADSTDSLELKNIWESHFDTPAVQPTKDDDGETITEAQGIGIDVLVRDGDEIKTEWWDEMETRFSHGGENKTRFSQRG